MRRKKKQPGKGEEREERESTDGEYSEGETRMCHLTVDGGLTRRITMQEQKKKRSDDDKKHTCEFFFFFFLCIYLTGNQRTGSPAAAS